ncbi:nucleoside permease [Coraliomargarita akajimensis]|uniref:Nucleoside:H symporter n=1 Tax=Coraliomargarita akajimensis (strain DSM 45221 / IAM 15411 / JCM 23193 / KCTC 12865 / 04OKA010-24) TaxID=583355 RepID=D5ENQ9_CORAD|nr:nucleoside permease [Coraliomargarita akajimensis]ADE53568.1 nucleoside:H symporter [Coraliomargarita akajimensis DSM 45221]
MSDYTMQRSISVRLSAMMFLQFFIWGAWFVTLGTYLSQGLGFEPAQIGRAYSTMSWGAVFAPFIAGMIADRFFAAEKVMAFMHLSGGAILFYASTLTNSSTLFWVLIAYAICYNPTLGLVNAISFNQMESPEKQFPRVRVFGTIGWIAAGLLIGFLEVEAENLPLIIAAAASVLLGVASLGLPSTPPKPLVRKLSISDVLGLETLKLMKQRAFAVFVIGSLLVCIPLAFYYNFANMFLNDVGVSNAAGKMTMGQMSEIVFMLVMPFFFVRLGVKKMLLIGMLAWVARYVLFAYGDSDSLVWMFYIGILLHGICYDFFFVTGQIYVDNTAPQNIQAQAQGFIAFITYGVGMVIGANLSGMVVQHFTTTTPSEDLVEQVIQWQQVWLVPALIAGVILILFAAWFKEEDKR